VSRVYIGLGSNLGNKINNLEKALIELKEIVKTEKVSSLYESEPWGYKQQDNFYNVVVEADTNLTPQELLHSLKEIELKLGRQEESVRWGPRVIDLDILLYGRKIIDLPGLKIPHSEIKNRVFVLLPLLELNPELTDPLSRKKFSEIAASIKDNVRIKKIAFFNKEKWNWNENI